MRDQIKPPTCRSWIVVLSLVMTRSSVNVNVNVNVNELFLSPRESCNIVTTAAP